MMNIGKDVREEQREKRKGRSEEEKTKK